MINFIKYRLKKLIWRANKLIFYRSSCFSRSSNFEGFNRIGRNSSFFGNMGLGSYIGDNCCIQGEIGRFTSIASNVSSRFAIHPYLEPYATTSPFFYSLKQPNTFAKKQIFIEHRYVDEKSKTPIVIGNDCWICERAFIQGGIRISDGVVVLAGAVVTKDIPPYSIVGGVPAKILKYRYDEDTINFLLKIKWWNNSIEWYKKNWELLCDIDKLKKHFNI